MQLKQMRLYLGLKSAFSMRVFQELTYSKQGSKCIYLMTKAFRIKNNYTLASALNYATKHALNLSIYIIDPIEENPKSMLFYNTNTKDLKTALTTYTSCVKRIKRFDINQFINQDVQAIFMDHMYLSFDIAFFEHIKQQSLNHHINLFQVEANVFVPVRVASQKEEYGAYTIRSKINALLTDYENEVLTVSPQTIGELKAQQKLTHFIEHIVHYNEHNDPSKDYTSRLSAYLKYGMISPVTIYHQLEHVDDELKASFLEELIIRRELAYNFVYYNPRYDRFNRMTVNWAYMTMQDHVADKRPIVYTTDDYVSFKTDDPYFNAAMKEMIFTGYMHGYMRMYWAKRIIGWSEDYKTAYDTILTLNNRYFIDGLTPNGYTGVAWCFGKHDRPWKERPIFGKLRYMNASGLKRKFDIDLYASQMNNIEKENV